MADLTIGQSSFRQKNAAKDVEPNAPLRQQEVRGAEVKKAAEVKSAPPKVLLEDRSGLVSARAEAQHQEIAEARGLEEKFAEGRAGESAGRVQQGISLLKNLLAQAKSGTLLAKDGVSAKVEDGAMKVGLEEERKGGSWGSEVAVSGEGGRVGVSSSQEVAGKELSREAAVSFSESGAVVEAGQSSKAADGSKSSVGGFVELGDGALAAGVEVGSKSAEGLSAKVSLAVGMSRGQEFEPGPNPGEWRTTFTTSASAKIGVAGEQEMSESESLGVGVKFEAEGQLRYSTTIDDKAKKNLNDGGTEPVPSVFDVRDPGRLEGSMRVGDQMDLSIRGSVQFRVPGKFGAVGVGAQVVAEGTFEAEVERLSDTKVRLLVKPTNVEGTSVWAGDSVGLVKAKVDLKKGDSLTQEFVFDLSNPAGRVAYAEAMQGKLPAAYSEAALEGDPRAVAARMAREPVGAGYVPTRLGQANFEEWGVGIESLVGGAGAGGKTQNSRNVAFERDAKGNLVSVGVTDGDLKEKTGSLWTLLSGSSTKSSSAELSVKTSRVAATGRETREVLGLHLEQKLGDTVTSTAELNDALAKAREMTGLPGLPAKTYGSDDWGGTEVSVRAKLTPEHVEKLARLDKEQINSIPGLSKDQKKALFALSQDVKTAAGKLEGYERQKAQMDALRAKVGDDVGEWMGPLNRALGLDVQLATSSTQIAGPIQQAERLLNRLPRQLPPITNDNALQVAQNLQKTASALKELDGAAARITADPFLGESEKRALRGQILNQRQSLEALRSSSGLGDEGQAKLLSALLASDHGQAGARDAAVQFIGQMDPLHVAGILGRLDLPKTTTATTRSMNALLEKALGSKDMAALRKLQQWNGPRAEKSLRDMLPSLPAEDREFVERFVLKGRK